MSRLNLKKVWSFFIRIYCYQLDTLFFCYKPIYFTPFRKINDQKKRVIFFKIMMGWGLSVFLQSSYALCSGTNCSCSVEVMPVNFGTYRPFSVEATTGLGKITVNCTAQTPGQISYTIALSAGGGSFASRAMVLGSKKLQYNLYKDSAYQLIWGDGSVGTSLVNDSYALVRGNNAKTYPVYGKIPAVQMVSVGVYSDIVTITVDY